MQQGEVLLHGAVQALFIEGEELEILRLLSEDVCDGEGGVDLRDIGAGLTPILKLAEGEEGSPLTEKPKARRKTHR